MSRNSISQTKRQIIFARDDWRCVYCGVVGDLIVEQREKPFRRAIIPHHPIDGKPFEIDHIIPVVKGGDNSLKNLASSCWKCNNAKADKKQKPAYRFFIIDFK